MLTKIRHKTRWSVLITTYVMVYSASTTDEIASRNEDRSGIENEVFNYYFANNTTPTTSSRTNVSRSLIQPTFPAVNDILSHQILVSEGTHSKNEYSDVVLRNNLNLHEVHDEEFHRDHKSMVNKGHALEINRPMNYKNDYAKDKIEIKSDEKDPYLRRNRRSGERISYGFHRGREGVRNTDNVRSGITEISEDKFATETNIELPKDYEGTPEIEDPAHEKEHFENPDYSSFQESTEEEDNMDNSQIENYSDADETPPLITNIAQIMTKLFFKQFISLVTERNTHQVDYDRAITIRDKSALGEGITSSESFRPQTRQKPRDIPNIDETDSSSSETLYPSKEQTSNNHAMNPRPVGEPRADSVSSYYDFLINEGSYKFWAVFQVVTALLLIYSAFAAIYYAKYTFSMMDYPDYLDDGFFFKRSGEAYVTTTTARPPSSYSFLGLSPQTFQRIMNALSSKKYS